MVLELRYAARSDVGLIRPGNEDSGYAGPHLLLVADGMGGHAAGELASATAIAIAARIDAIAPDESDSLDMLTGSVGEIGAQIARTIEENPDFTGMGTTLTGLYLVGDQMNVVHVGDSRAYLLRDGELTQVTHDHTYVQTLIDAGKITEDEAMHHPRRSLLMRALDGMHSVEADVFVIGTQAGDRFLICSDGLSGVVPDAQITQLLSSSDPTGSVTALVERALQLGAPDNVTVVVADIIAEPTETDVFAGSAPPVVVGAAGERRVRARLPHVRFPDDAQVDPNRPDLPPAFDSGPPTAEQPLIDSNVQVPASMASIEAERQHKRRVHKRIGYSLMAIAIVVIVGGLVLFGANTWVKSQWYVAAFAQCGAIVDPTNGAPVCTNNVAVFNGVPNSFMGRPLSQLNRDTGLAVSSLQMFDQELVNKGIPASNQADAERIVAELGRRAAECQTIVPPDGCPTLSSAPAATSSVTP